MIVQRKMMFQGEFSKVPLSTCTTMCTITMSEIGSIRSLEYYGFDPVIMETAFVACYFMQRGMRVAHILARKLHGWLGFRTEQGEPFPRRRLLFVSFDRSIFPCIHAKRVTLRGF